MQRTLALQTIESVDKHVMLQGWVDTVRRHGKIVFVDLRDRSGKVQLVGDKSLGELRGEDVIEVAGMVKKRPDQMVNPDSPTGTVEVEIAKLTVLNKAKELPFPIDTDGYDINEEVRTKYRYLDIRRPRMSRNLRLRSQFTTFIRNYLTERDFVEIETPMLTKTTPEGARDFIVPSRLQPGKFYALPQSPQQYKQLLMVAGMERYFQIVRCFRDEDPRKDRAYGEFTQLDIELSFVTQEDILLLIEDMFTALVKKLFPEKHMSQSPWPRIPHREAMKQYGTDKPDLRKNKNDPNELAFAWTVDFPLFTEQSEEDFYHGSGSAKFAPSHHMFTAPVPEDIPFLDSDPMKVRGLQHDLVLNGYEVGGGSIRIHQREIQEKIFDLIGFSEEQKHKFDHMLNAFTFGVPPHGGIAPGVDRFLMAALGEPSVREVMAFPTTASGQISVMDAPSVVDPTQLEELGITIRVKGNVFEQIVADFTRKHIPFTVSEHEPVKTSEEAAKVRNVPLSTGAKAIVLFADGKPLMVVVTGDRRIDTKALKSLYSFKDLRMATEEEVERVTGVQVGAVPPLGTIFGIPLYMDALLRQNETVYFNPGLHTKTIAVKEIDYEKAAQPIVGEFSK